MHPILTLVWRLSLCVAATWLLSRWLGAAMALVFLSPLFGIAVARPVIDLLGDSRRATRQLALQSVSGRYYAFKGHAIDIVDDVDGHRWLRTADVRKVITGLPRDGTLLRMFPGAAEQPEPPTDPRIRAEQLAEYLLKATDADALRFKLWLEREVILPARKRRERLPSGRRG